MSSNHQHLKTPAKHDSSKKLYHCAIARYDARLDALLNFELARGGFVPKSRNAQQDFPVVKFFSNDDAPFANHRPRHGDLVSVTFVTDTGIKKAFRRSVLVHRLPDADQNKSPEYRLTGAFFEHHAPPDAGHEVPFVIENVENKRFRVFGQALPSEKALTKNPDTFAIFIAKSSEPLRVRCGDQFKEC